MNSTKKGFFERARIRLKTCCLVLASIRKRRFSAVLQPPWVQMRHRLSKWWEFYSVDLLKHIRQKWSLSNLTKMLFQGRPPPITIIVTAVNASMYLCPNTSIVYLSLQIICWLFPSSKYTQETISYYVDFNHIVSKPNLLKRCEAHHSSVHKPAWFPNTKENQESFCVPTLLYQLPDLSASFLFPQYPIQSLSHHSLLVAPFHTPYALFPTMACSLYTQIFL